MKKLALLISIIALSAGFVCAQNTGGIKGQVRSFDGDGISNVEVTARQEGEDIKSVKSIKKEICLGRTESRENIMLFSAERLQFGIEGKHRSKRKKDQRFRRSSGSDVDKGTQVIINGSVFNQDGLRHLRSKNKSRKSFEQR